GRGPGPDRPQRRRQEQPDRLHAGPAAAPAGPGAAVRRPVAVPGRRAQGDAGIRTAAAAVLRLDEGGRAVRLPGPALPHLGPCVRGRTPAALGDRPGAADRQAVPRPGPAPALARALAPHPSLLVLDEPASALDPLARRELLREPVTRALVAGTTVLLSSHIVSDLERVASRGAFLAEGRLLLAHPLVPINDGIDGL